MADQNPILVFLREISSLKPLEEMKRLPVLDNMLEHLFQAHRMQVPEQNLGNSYIYQLEPVSIDAIGQNCLRLYDVLTHLEQQDSSAYDHIRRFHTDPDFHEYCLGVLDSFQKKTQELLFRRRKTKPSLEERRKARDSESIADANEIYQEAKEYSNAAQAALEEAKKLHLAAEETKRAADSIIPNMLTTLGVFIAIIIAVVACYLTLLFTQHGTASLLPKSIVMCCVMGHLLMGIIFLLLYLISKLTNYPMACHCFVSRETDCSKCPNEFRSKCTLLNRIWLRYPYVVLINLGFFIIYLVLGLWGFLSRYLGGHLDATLKSSRSLVIVVAGAAILLFTALCALLIHKMRWNKKN